MRTLIESTLVSLDGVIESPDRWAPITGDPYIEKINAMPWVRT